MYDIYIDDKISRKSKMIIINKNKEIIKDVLYINIKEEINVELNDARILEVNKRRNMMRVVVDNKFKEWLEELDRNLIEKLKSKVELLDECGVKDIQSNFISNKMIVDDKCIISLIMGDNIYDENDSSIKFINGIYGLNISGEIMIRDIQVVNGKCTYGMIIKRAVVKGGNKCEIYGEILEDEYYM